MQPKSTPSARKVIRHYLFAALSALFLLSYQNCSRFESVLQEGTGIKLSSSDSGSDNGTPYDGKISQYARWSPEFSCEGKPQPLATVELRNFEKVLVENSSLQCEWKSQVLKEEDIETSLFQHEIWGYREGIFTAQTESSALSSAIPAELVEVWCNDSRNDLRSEIILYYDHQAQKARLNLYTQLGSQPNGDLIQLKIADPARLVSQSLVQVSSAQNNFQLTLHRDQPNPRLIGLFKTEISYTISGQQQSFESQCRLGGTLDPQIWPARQIVDVDVDRVIQAPNNNDFLFGYQSSSGQSKIGWGQISTMKSQPLKIQAQARGVGYIDFANDSEQVVFVADLTKPYLSELFTDNISNLKSPLNPPRRISSALSLENQSVQGDVQFIKNLGIVLYRDGIQDSSADIEPWLRKTTLATGEVSLINQPLTEVDDEVQSFNYASGINRVVYLGGFTHPSLYSANPDGSDHRKMCLNLATNEFLRYAQDINFLEDHRSFLVETYFNYSINLRVHLVDTITGTSRPMPLNHWVRAFDIESKHGILIDNQSQENKFYSMSSNTLSTLSSLKIIDVDLVAADQGKVILAEKLNPTATSTKEIYALNLTNLTISAVCSLPTDGEILTYVKEDKSGWVISVIDSQSRQIQITEIGLDLKCRLKNRISVPDLDLVKQKVQYISLSPDSSKALLAIGDRPLNWYSQTTTSRLFMAPLDGRAPLQINSGLTDSDQISQFQWSNDSRSIFFFGLYRGPTEKRGYIWKVP